MDVDEYRGALRAVLDTVSRLVAERISTIELAASTGTAGVLIEVFLDDDAEGTFAIWTRFEGADALILDRKLGDERELLSVVWGEKNWEPPVPARPRDWSRKQLEIALVQVVAEWIEPLIPQREFGVHWKVVTPDDTVEPIPLSL